MAFNNTLTSLVNSRTALNKAGSESTYSTFGRVIDIILDEKHPEYDKQGGGLSINGVFYKPLFQNQLEGESTELPFAMQYSSHIKTVPIIGEIVEVVKMPNQAVTSNTRRNKQYYTRIVNTWNNANSNVYLDMNSNTDLDISTGGNFKELATVNPVRSTPGDVQIEGRQGQSIRFTGGKGTGNPWVDDENLGSPLIIISNGQSQTDEGFTTLGENVDEDGCSIYLATNHTIPLTPASEKRKSFTELPDKSDQFKGNQIVLNGGRLYLNAKENDIQLSSVTSIGMNTEGSVNIDASSYLCLDAPMIYLGERARRLEDEPAIKGDALESYLDTLNSLLINFCNTVAAGKGVPKTQAPVVNLGVKVLKSGINNLQSIINPGDKNSNLKSKKVFIQ